jgi:uncharacterized protein YnzC (UPF0291/DUF896 family)
MKSRSSALLCGKDYPANFRIEEVKFTDVPTCQRCAKRINEAIALRKEAFLTAAERRKEEEKKWRENLTPSEFIAILAEHFQQFTETVMWDDYNSPGRCKVSSVHYIHNGVVICNREIPGGDTSAYYDMRRATCRQCRLALHKKEVSANCKIERALELCLKRCGLPQYQLDVIGMYYRKDGAGRAIEVIDSYLNGGSKWKKQ